MPDALDVPSFYYADPRAAGELSYPQLEARRRIAMALATRNRPYPKTIGEGLTALGEGLGEGMVNSNLQQAEGAQRARDAGAASVLMGGKPAAPAPPVAPGRVSDAGPDVADPMDAVAMATPEDIALANAEQQKPPSMSIEEWKQRVARNESGGSRDPYSALGELSRRGDRAYGKYQVMGENIPKWTKQFVGREMTPEEFLADKEAQETVASGQGGKYLAKYGGDGAARAWFAGERGMNDPNRKDTLGTHVAEYSRRFNLPLGVNRNSIAAAAAKNPNAFDTAPEMPPEAVAALASASPDDVEQAQAPVKLAALGGGATATDAGPGPDREAIVAALAQQQGIRPQQFAQAAPAQLPQAPPALPPGTPIVTPQSLPKPPVQPAQPVEPGAEPRPDTYRNDPRLKEQMDNARRIALDDKYSPAIQAQARDAYQRLDKQAEEAYTKQWTVWHERTKAKEAFKLTEEEKNLQNEKLRGEAYDAAEKRVLTHRLGGQDPQKFFDNFAKEQSTADIAGKIREDNKIILKAVNDGVIMGTGAGWRLNAAKLASWAFQNGYASEQAANTEIMRALGGSRIREALSQVNPVGVASNTDLLLARQLSGSEPSMEPKSFMKLLHKSSEYNAKLLNDYEDKKDYYLSGTRAERQFNLNLPPTSPTAARDNLLMNRDNKELRAQYDNTYGEGSSALEIERFKRRQRRGE